MLSIFEIFLIAFAMSADAFSVAFGIGCSFHTPRHYFRLGWHFGLFQFLMPVIGAFIGKVVMKWTNHLDLIAAIILFYIAYHMIKEALKKEEERCSLADPTKGLSLVILSLATSMDALGVGVSLALYNGNILLPASIIGVVCGIATVVGVYFGKISKKFTGRFAEMAGALVLIGIGFKFILV
ncbi:MAG: manganese efflux pump MntP family protein [Calditerrivibrio sp.]|nr:manganese efflux pump MntP family protein [Calditerrivibrio sp.]